MGCVDAHTQTQNTNMMILCVRVCHHRVFVFLCVLLGGLPWGLGRRRWCTHKKTQKTEKHKNTHIILCVVSSCFCVFCVLLGGLLWGLGHGFFFPPFFFVWNGFWQDLAFEHLFMHARVSYTIMMPAMCSAPCRVRRARARGRVRACRPSRQIADRPAPTFGPVSVFSF